MRPILPRPQCLHTAKSIGVLGGTFDPIHLAHLHLAQKSLEAFHLDQVYFLVARRPPHKFPGSITSAYHRFAMTTTALEPFPCFLASTTELELERNVSNYTCDTLEAICRENQVRADSLFFIAGGDSFLTVNTWKNYQSLLRNYNFVFFERPEAAIGQDFSHLPASICRRILDLRTRADNPIQNTLISPAIYLLDAGAPPISSSAIRERIAGGKEFSQLVPANVHQYICKYHLYL